LKERTESREGGSVGKEESPGSFRRNDHPLPPDQNRGEGGIDRAGRPAGVLAGGQVHGDAREMGQNGEEAEGISAPCSPCAMVSCRGGSAGRGGLEVAALGDSGALVLMKEGVSMFKPLDLHRRYPQQGRRWGSPCSGTRRYA
jgi:hypothetical protein